MDMSKYTSLSLLAPSRVLERHARAKAEPTQIPMTPARTENFTVSLARPFASVASESGELVWIERSPLTVGTSSIIGCSNSNSFSISPGQSAGPIMQASVKYEAHLPSIHIE